MTRIGLDSSLASSSALCASLQVRSKPPPGEAGAMHSGRLGSAARAPANSRVAPARVSESSLRDMADFLLLLSAYQIGRE
ncbi:hypothetical protein D3C78_1679960 [compost metagenome]